MPTLELIRPTVSYKDSYMSSVYEYLAEGMAPSWNIDILTSRFDEFVQMLLDKETHPASGLAPESVYWAVVGDVFVGRLSVRHQLIGNLINYGGHIGYDIRPTERNKGYGTEQCRLGILRAREKGISRILITCNDDNIGSIKIIEANGGVLEDKRDNGLPVLTRRYWIEAPTTN